MHQTGAIAGSGQIPESQKAALLKLLADDDPGVYHSIRQRILSFGPTASGWLQPHLLARDPVLRRRTQEIVRHFERQAADDAFLEFCLKHGQDFDLEQGSWLLAQTCYPNINLEAYRALLDSYATDARERLATAGTEPSKALTALNRFLFDELRFTGNEENYYEPDNSYLNRVLDRRTGNPINLCLVYLLVAKRLKLPVVGIGLPGHFICRFQSSATEIYIDAFNRGKLLSKADCVQYLLQSNYSVRDDYLSPVSPRRMLLRTCGNLHQIYLNLQQPEATTRLQRYLVVLAR